MVRRRRLQSADMTQVELFRPKHPESGKFVDPRIQAKQLQIARQQRAAAGVPCQFQKFLIVRITTSRKWNCRRRRPRDKWVRVTLKI